MPIIQVESIRKDSKTGYVAWQMQETRAGKLLHGRLKAFSNQVPTYTIEGAVYEKTVSLIIH